MFKRINRSMKAIQALSLAVLIAMCSCQHKPLSLEQARKIHFQILTIDTHTDVPDHFGKNILDVGLRHEPGKPGSGQLDLPRMKEGGLDAVFFAAYVGQRERTPENYTAALVKADETILGIKNIAVKYPALVAIGTSPEDAYRNDKAGLLTIYIGLENGFPLAQDIANVRRFYDMGVRYITLCHVRNNDICDSSTDSKGAEHGGLSLFGEQVVKEMNRLGMIIDVSHMSDSAFYDVLKCTRAPVIASHSCARALCDNPRNMSDEMLRALAKNGGVMQLCLLSDYVKPMPGDPEREQALLDFRARYGPRDQIKDEAVLARRDQERSMIDQKYPPRLATLQDAVDHIDHVVKLVGIDYVGIGTDFDGGGGIAGCNDVTDMPGITVELLKRRYTIKDIEKIWSGNFLRVFRKVIQVAEERS
jgi:membrane dipeptidase